MENERSSIIAIENSIREKKHSVKVFAEDEQKKIIDEIERKYPDLPQDMIRTLRDGFLSKDQLNLIHHGIDRNYSDHQIRELCNPEYDVWQIRLICVGFDNGMPLEMIQPYLDLSTVQTYEQRENGLLSVISKQQSTVRTKVTSASHTVMTAKYKKERG